MKFNKIVALALALVMVFALCACGGGDTNKKDDSGSTAKVDTSTVSVGAVVIARDDVPTDQIYAFVSTIFNNLDAIAARGAEHRGCRLRQGRAVSPRRCQVFRGEGPQG